MNKKKIILLFILTLVGILCVFLNGKEEPEIGVGQNKVSFSNKTNSFYYDQLDETEKRVCNDITALVEQGNGGKIDLTAPISTYRYLRIVRTLSFDPEYQNWAISLIFPVGENNKLIDRNTINDDCNIMKLYVLVNDSKKRKELKNFKLVLNDENIITNIDELEKGKKDICIVCNCKNAETLNTFLCSDVRPFEEWIKSDFDKVLSGEIISKEISGNVCCAEINFKNTKIYNMLIEDDDEY